jgi:O-antigen ligase
MRVKFSIILDIFFWALASIIAVFPFSLKACNLLILVLAGVWVICAILKQISFIRWQGVVVLSSVFIAWSISLLYSHDISSGVYALEKKIPLLIFPLVLGTIPQFETRKLNYLIRIALLSALSALFYCCIHAMLKTNLNPGGSFYWTPLVDPIDFHPAYLGLYLNILSVCILFPLAGHEPLIKNKFLLYFIYLLLLVSQFLISSKIQIILGGMILIFHFAISFNKKVVLSLFMLLIFLFSILYTQSSSGIKERFGHVTTLSYNLTDSGSHFNELTIRFALAECSFHTIKKSPLIGVGAGDAPSELLKTFYELDYKVGYLDQQNPHNEYLSQFIAVGTLGFIILLFTLCFQASKAFQIKDYTHIGIILLFGVSFIFESMLERQKGIVMFALVSALFYFHRRRIPKASD